MNDKPKNLPPQTQTDQPGHEHEMTPAPIVIAPTYKGSDKLKEKVALITGGDSGIGRAIAVHYAREGANIAIVYKDETQDAQETLQMIRTEGANCLLLSGDVKSEIFCKQAVQNTIDYYGKLNILVNNAAVQYPQKDITDISSEQLHDTFQINMYAYFYFVQAALPHLKEDDCIINTTSVTAYKGHELLIDYASTKGAIVAFTRSLAQNLASKQIRVNAVAPGPIWTPLIPATFDAAHVAAFGKSTPLGRVGQPSEVAPAYVFLASRDGSYFTGQVLHPNGGDVING